VVRSVMLHHAGPAVHRIGPLSSNVRPREQHERLAGFVVAAMGRAGTRSGRVVPVRFVHRCRFPPARLDQCSEGTRFGVTPRLRSDELGPWAFF